jgi:hypothetical protein
MQSRLLSSGAWILKRMISEAGVRFQEVRQDLVW